MRTKERNRRARNNQKQPKSVKSVQLMGVGVYGEKDVVLE